MMRVNYVGRCGHSDYIQGLSRKYPGIFNISRTSRVALMYLGSQTETLLCICEQLPSRGASQSAVRRRWLSLCTVWLSHSQISFSTAISTLGRIRSRREPNLGCRGTDRPGWCDVLPKKACMRAVEWAGTVMQICWSAHLVIVNVTVTQCTSSVSGISLPTD